MTSTATHDDRLLDRLLERRIVVLADQVDDASARRVIAQLLVLADDDPEADIALHINSPGGSVLAGFGIYDVMQVIPNDVMTVAVGLAASMGQVLLCAGTPGKRFALPNAQVLLHEGSAGIGGSAADVEIQARNLEWTLERMRQLIAHHTGHTLDEIRADVGRDRWFDAAAAQAYGFVDHVVTSLDEISVPAVERRVGLR